MSQAQGVFIDVVGYSVARDGASRPYVVYIIKIRLGGFHWTVYRRYSDFHALSVQLRKTIPSCAPCPPKRVWSTHSPAFLEQRRVDLLEWIRTLASDANVCRSPQLHKFLRDDANAPPPGLTPLEPGMTLEPEWDSPEFDPTPRPAPTPPPHAKSGSRMGLHSFSLLKVVGKGSFGKVMQVRKKDTGAIYAMKVLNKANIIRRNQVEHTRTERAVLGRIQHPYIVGLNYAFQTADKLYFVLDYCAGGELFFHLGKEGKFTEPRARFYTAQIVLALEHLHGIDVIYRDLKPENVLLDHYGNVRLTDFGLSKENISATNTGAYTFCGTPEYLAPEILNRAGHGRAVDWWSLGTLLYEMLTGLPPFYCKDAKALFDKIRRGKLEYPDGLSAEARDLLGGLLTRDPVKRLGCGPDDASELKSHPFFRDVDWVALAANKVPAPWRPAVAHSLDTSQFDQQFTSMPLVSPKSKEASVAPVQFEGFTYVPDSPKLPGPGAAAAPPAHPTLPPAAPAGAGAGGTAAAAAATAATAATGVYHAAPAAAPAAPTVMSTMAAAPPVAPGVGGYAGSGYRVPAMPAGYATAHGGGGGGGGGHFHAPPAPHVGGHHHPVAAHGVGAAPQPTWRSPLRATAPPHVPMHLRTPGAAVAAAAAAAAHVPPSPCAEDYDLPMPLST